MRTVPSVIVVFQQIVEMGHTDPALALRVYRQNIHRGP
jgi:hypothetical protein